MPLRSPRIARFVVPLIAGMMTAGPSMAAGFTAEQAAAGETAYNSQCAQCHGRQLEGPEAPGLAGQDVMQNWHSAGGLYDFISVAMPPSAPGQLGEETYLNIIAYIMEFNGAAPGDEPLTADPDLLYSVLLAEETAAGAAAAPAAADAAPAAEATSVPQAFTWGKQLPGSPASAEPAAPTAAEEPSVPQAFTWGQQLPTAGAN